MSTTYQQHTQICLLPITVFLADKMCASPTQTIEDSEEDSVEEQGKGEWAHRGAGVEDGEVGTVAVGDGVAACWVGGAPPSAGRGSSSAAPGLLYGGAPPQGSSS
jgi:hypothetical protein